MKPLRHIEQEFWDAYTKTLQSQMPAELFVEASFAGNREITDDLIRLYLEGKKWAGSGLVKDYKVAGDPLPKVGNFWIVLDKHEKPRLILKTIRTEINPFGEMTDEIARAEGEGDLSVRYWKDAHREFFTPHLAKWGIANLDKADVITEFFEIVYKK